VVKGRRASIANAPSPCWLMSPLADRLLARKKCLNPCLHWVNGIFFGAYQRLSLPTCLPTLPTSCLPVFGEVGKAVALALSRFFWVLAYLAYLKYPIAELKLIIEGGGRGVR